MRKLLPATTVFTWSQLPGFKLQSFLAQFLIFFQFSKSTVTGGSLRMFILNRQNPILTPLPATQAGGWAQLVCLETENLSLGLRSAQRRSSPHLHRPVPSFQSLGGRRDMGSWEGSAHHLAATFMVPHCPSFGNEAPLIFFSGCKRNCPSLNIREPPSAWSPSIFLHSCFSLFLPFSFSKRTFITPPSHPAAFLPSLCFGKYLDMRLITK